LTARITIWQQGAITDCGQPGAVTPWLEAVTLATPPPQP